MPPDTAADLFALPPWGWGLAAVAAALIGLAKTGVPGVGILAVPLMAHVFPAGESTGILLPVLVAGDLFAVGYYRRHAEWSHVRRALPWAMAGILLGFVTLRTLHLSDGHLKHLIGLIVLAVLGMNLWLARRRESLSLPRSTAFAAALGLLGGFATMAANAAGPIFIVYLMAQRLPKHAFIGTSAWLYLILNVFKLPFSYGLGFLSLDSLLFDLKMLPALAAGAVAGILALNAIPQRAFDAAVKILAAVAAIRLILG